jgi:UbiD family decarboxylase
MPFALVQGAEPAALFAGGMPLDYGVDEVGYLCALFGEPLELVRCKTEALEVPATAEIIGEGHVSLDETASEGPFGEYHGYLRDEKYNFPSITSARSHIGTIRSCLSHQAESRSRRITRWPGCVVLRYLPPTTP